MKIAVIGIKGIPAKYGGFETCVDETSHRLAKKGIEINVFCRNPFTTEKISKYRGVKLKYVATINSKNFSTISSSFLSVVSVIFSPIDIVHLYTVGNSIFIPLLKLFRKQCVISVDALDWKRRKWSGFASKYIKYSELLAVKFADSVISDSRVICDYYKSNYGRDIDYVPFGANMAENTAGDETLAKFKLTSKKYFLFVGLFRPEKNVDLLIKAFNHAKTNDKELVLIGDDPMNAEYVTYIHSLKTKKIKFLGRIYGQEYEDISKNAFCYVTASEVEGTSPALLGAMGFRTAVLVSDIRENLEVISDSGFSFEANNENSLIERIEYLISNPRRVEFYASKAKDRVEKYYNWDKVSEELYNIYKKIL